MCVRLSVYFFDDVLACVLRYVFVWWFAYECGGLFSCLFVCLCVVYVSAVCSFVCGVCVLV